MATTLEDLDHRLTALEKAAQTEENVGRAVAEIVADSEKRVREQVQGLQKEVAGLRTDVTATEERLSTGLRTAAPGGMHTVFRPMMRGSGRRASGANGVCRKRRLDRRWEWPN